MAWCVLGCRGRGQQCAPRRDTGPRPVAASECLGPGVRAGGQDGQWDGVHINRWRAYWGQSGKVGAPQEVSLAEIRPTQSSEQIQTNQQSWTLYDDLGRAAKQVDALGYVRAQHFDALGRVIGQTSYVTPIDTSTITANTRAEDITPQSDANDRVGRMFYQGSRQVGSLDGAGYLTEQRYDALGRVIETIRYANATDSTLRASGGFTDLLASIDKDASQDQHTHTIYDARGQVTGVIDSEGYLTENVYDDLGRVIETIRYATVVDTSNLNQQTIDSLRPSADAQDQHQSQVYNALGQVVTQTHHEGTTTRFHYDGAGRQTHTEVAFGTSEQRDGYQRYDKDGRVMARLSGVGAAQLNALASDASAAEREAIWTNHGTHIDYDARGQQRALTDANGHQSLFYYNEDGQLVYTINAQGEVQANRYNALNQQIENIVYNGRIDTQGLIGGQISETLLARIAAIESAQDSHTQTQYTVRGAVKQVIDAEGYTTSHTYTAFGELAEQALPNSLTESSLNRFIL